MTALHAALLALLRTQPNVSVYDGTVPENLPRDRKNRVLPYAVLWGNPGSFPEAEANTLSDEDSGELYWEARVTVASGDPGWTLDAASGIRSLVNRKILLPRAGVLREPEGSVPTVQVDRDVKPLRWFTPLVFYTMSA